jgi:hypothetical protein
MRFKKGPEVPVQPAAIRAEAAACRYCAGNVDRLILTDGRVLTVDPDRTGGRGGMFARSHWRTCKAIQGSGRDYDAGIEGGE